MTVTEIKTLGKTGRVRVTLDYDTTFPLYKTELKKYSIEEGCEISKEEYASILNEILFERAKNRAVHLLEKSDRTESDIRKKLKEGYYPDDAIENAVSMLKEYHYIDDLEYAKSYIRTFGELKSRKMISMKLLEKGIDRDIIDKALDEELQMDQSDLIVKLLTKRHYDRENADKKERERTIRYLLGKGFSYDSFSDLI